MSYISLSKLTSVKTLQRSSNPHRLLSPHIQNANGVILPCLLSRESWFKMSISAQYGTTPAHWSRHGQKFTAVSSEPMTNVFRAFLGNMGESLSACIGSSGGAHQLFHTCPLCLSAMGALRERMNTAKDFHLGITFPSFLLHHPCSLSEISLSLPFS